MEDMAFSEVPDVALKALSEAFSSEDSKEGGLRFERNAPELAQQINGSVSDTRRRDSETPQHSGQPEDVKDIATPSLTDFRRHHPVVDPAAGSDCQILYPIKLISHRKPSQGGVKNLPQSTAPESASKARKRRASSRQKPGRRRGQHRIGNTSTLPIGPLSSPVATSIAETIPTCPSKSSGGSFSGSRNCDSHHTGSTGFR